MKVFNFLVIKRLEIIQILIRQGQFMDKQYIKIKQLIIMSKEHQ